MTRDDLIRRLVDKQPHLSYKTICDAVKLLTENMTQSLSKGFRIEIRGFGGFSLRSKLPCFTRNPKTGEVVYTERRFSVHFKPGKKLRERVCNAYKII